MKRQATASPFRFRVTTGRRLPLCLAWYRSWGDELAAGTVYAMPARKRKRQKRRASFRRLELGRQQGTCTNAPP